MARWVEFDWGSAETKGVDEVSGPAAEAFSASMPARYRVLFDLRAARKHAGICLRRGQRPAYVEVWRTLADGSAALCVVADDRPGLLSAIAAALVFHRFDVITALVFSRETASGRSAREAVDLVWIRRANSEDRAPIEEEEATSIGQVLSAILSGTISVEEIAAKTPARANANANANAHPHQEMEQAQQGASSAEIVVRFDEEDAEPEEGLSPLIVEAADRPGVLLTITREIFQQGGQIVRSLVRSAGGRAFNHFELAEFNGGRLTSERREQIRSAVFAALSLHETRPAHTPGADDIPDPPRPLER